MTLDLYHSLPAANSLKTLIASRDKGVEFNSRFINLHEFEQHEPWFVKINPNGQVIPESTVINGYMVEIKD